MKSTLQIVHVSQIGDSNTSEPAVVALSGNRILRELSEVTNIDFTDITAQGKSEYSTFLEAVTSF